MADSAQFLNDLIDALDRRDPRRLAASLQAMISSSRTWAGQGRWAALRPLADAADDLLAGREPELAGDEVLSGLATLARQVCLILALMGDAEGVRDSGYFRASMAHARRIDAMTDGRLGLVDLVNLIRE